jgi:hypothetical protein
VVDDSSFPNTLFSPYLSFFSLHHAAVLFQEISIEETILLSLGLDAESALLSLSELARETETWFDLTPAFSAFLDFLSETNESPLKSLDLSALSAVRRRIRFLLCKHFPDLQETGDETRNHQPPADRTIAIPLFRTQNLTNCSVSGHLR